MLDPAVAKETFTALHQAMRRSGPLLPRPERGRSGRGRRRDGFRRRAGGQPDPRRASCAAAASTRPRGLFSESNTRFLCEVRPAQAAAFESALANVPHARIGQVTTAANLVVAAGGAVVLESDLETLREAWKRR